MHKFLIHYAGYATSGEILGPLDLYRRPLLNAAKALFLFGAAVGLVSPLYWAIERLYILYIFTIALPGFLFEVAVSLSAALLCLTCYLSLRAGRMRLASIRAAIATALFFISGAWLAGLPVLAAMIISAIYET